MGKKRKLEDREIKKTVSREKLLKISKRKLKQVKRVKHLIHRTVLIQNTITYLKHTEIEHEVLNHSPDKKTKCDKYDIANSYHPFDTTPPKDMFANLDFSQPENFFLSLDSSMTLQAPDNVEDMFEYLDFTQPEHIFSSLASSLC